MKVELKLAERGHGKLFQVILIADSTLKLSCSPIQDREVVDVSRVTFSMVAFSSLLFIERMTPSLVFVVVVVVFVCFKSSPQKLVLRKSLLAVNMCYNFI